MVNRRGCCSYPNGCITLGPSLLIFPALLFTFWSVFSCNFVNYETEKENYTTAIGLFWKYVPYLYNTMGERFEANVVVVGSCNPYTWFGESVIQIDGPFRAARGLGLMAVACGCVMIVVVWIIAPCIPISKIGWRMIGLILAMIGLFQMLTLLILSSNACSSKCTNLGVGGILSIVSGVLWFVSALLCCFVGDPIVDESLPIAVRTVAHESPNHLELSPVVKEQTTTQQHVEEDGTIVIEKTTTRADGGVTVTTEVIPPGTAVGSVVAGKM